MNDISIIIVSYYTSKVIFECIDSCKALNGIKEIIIVNNGNPEDDLRSLKELATQDIIKLVDGHGNIGFSKGCNLGASIAAGNYFLFMNPDCYTHDIDFAFKLKNALIGQKEYWFATSVIYNSDGSIQQTCRRNLINFSNAVIQSFGLDKFGFTGINRNVSEIDLLPEISPLEAFSGALFMCDKHRFYQIGALSEEYFLHVEDMDLCMKINRAGGKICFIKSAKIYHYLSTSKTTKRFLEEHKARGFIIYLNKFFPWTRFWAIRYTIYLGIWLRYYIKSL
ncbi:MAG: glycosyltransferase family 2 protein [Rickettsiaceae bacterium]|nr:glycosyltransferase family 2 protein [Rickettsiaceae bacterium]